MAHVVGSNRGPQSCAPPWRTAILPARFWRRTTTSREDHMIALGGGGHDFGGHSASLPRPAWERVGRGGHDDSVSHRSPPLIPPSPPRGEGVKSAASLTTILARRPRRGEMRDRG